MSAHGGPSASDVAAARELLRDVAHHTPLIGSRTLGEVCGGEILVKAEQLQRTGSFKIRGAYVHIANLPAERRAAGVVAASAGNHAQGVAWAASRLGVPATVVMPVSASLAKVEATRSYGAAIETVGETVDEALARAREVADERDAVLVHPFDDDRVIAGQGTLGLEMAEDAPEVDRVLVGVGGGGLIAGTAIALRAARPGLRIVGVRAASPRTIADGAAVADLGERARPIVEALVDDVVTVDEEAISEAILLFAERTKQVVEGAGAMPLAALLSGAEAASGTSLLVASGGNIDPGLLVRVLRHGLGESGRYLFVRIMLEDRPGRLHDVLAHVAELRANVVSVVHHRAGLTLPVGAVEVELTLETRGREHAAGVVRSLAQAGYDVRRG